MEFDLEAEFDLAAESLRSAAALLLVESRPAAESLRLAAALLLVEFDLVAESLRLAAARLLVEFDLEAAVQAVLVVGGSLAAILAGSEVPLQVPYLVVLHMAGHPGR